MASAITFGKRDEEKVNAGSVSLTLLGTCMLWFGWFGFNGGSVLAANNLAAIACINTNLAASSAGLAWVFWQSYHGGQISILGFACGAVCGLVGITPGAGYVPLYSSILIGIIGATFSYFFCHYKSKFYQGFDDTLDVFGCHGI